MTHQTITLDAAIYQATTQELALLRQRVMELEAASAEPSAESSAAFLEVENFFKLSLDMLCIVTIDGYFKLLNPSWEETLGFTLEELYAHPFIEFVHLEDCEATIAVVEQLKEQPTLVNFENRYRCKDGSYKWLTWTSVFLDERQLIYAVARDITDYKRSQAALCQSEQYNRQLFEASPVGLVLSRMDGTIIDANPALAAIMGRTVPEMLQLTCWEITPEQYVAAEQAVLEELEQTGRYKSYEKEYIHKDGHRVAVRLSGLLIEQGGECLIWSSVEDISDLKLAQQERQQTEQTLQQSEERYRSLVKTTSQIVWVSTPEGHCFDVADWIAYSGQSEAEAKGLGWLDALHPDDRLHASEVWTAATTSLALYEVEYRIRAKDGTYRDFFVCGAPVLEQDGSIREWVGTCTDITDRKLAEQILQQSEERYRFLISAMAQIVWDTKAEGEFVTEQPGWSQFTGQNFEQLKGWGWLDAIHPDDRAHTAEVWLAAFTTRSLYAVEHRLRRHDGQYRHMSVRAVPVIESDGSTREWIGAHTDIHDRKVAEAENQRLLNMLNHSSDAIIVRDMTDKILYWNQGAERLYGWVREEVKDQPIHSFLHTIFPQPVEQIQAQLLQQGTWEGELQHTSRNERSLTVQSRWTLQRDSSGQPCALLEINTDITARKQTEIALRQLNQELEARVIDRTAALQNTLAEAQGLNAILDNLADGLLVTDTEGQITHSNPAFLAMYGLIASNLKGQCRELPVSGLAELVEKTQSHPQEVFTAEVDLAKNRIGQAVATTIFKKASAEPSSTCFGSALLIRDVTAEKEIDKMKTDFISTVSHELRTPLTSVLGFASIIKEKLENDIFPILTTEDRKLQKTIKRVNDNLNIIVSEAERLTSLINDVLDIAKMEAGKVEWQMQPLDPVELVEWATNSTASLFETSRLQMVNEIDAELPQIMGDRNRLLQVLINLISNAVKFTEAGTVTCQVRQESSGVCISISDTGVGIAPEDQPKVFEKFRQVGDTLTDKPKGTGLGLPICKQIVDHHGGKIWVESETGKGSKFSFVIPTCAADHKTTDKLNLDALVKQLKEHVTTTTTTLDESRKTILVVDDDTNIRELLRQQLENEGYNVREAKDGMDAIQQIKSARPDLILLDVMMPQINGFDVAAVLKHDPETADIPIIILSIVENKERGYHIGIDRYLTKPIDTEKLLNEIGSLLSQGTSSKKVLVVDQNASTLKVLSDVLQTQGYNVLEASDPQECINKALTAKPDMIIIDSILSQEADLMKTLRFEKGLENVFFVMLSDR
ncbi:MAG: PAS domain S-box protein [Drouetiella hepatica Uher 2000/2452]|jgi:PAS domain S-box-containing protein|uniref:Circadian input-output histidine kinase CikA n=1 Tax=Drouetiella hepatica Uher 2000/2452 TaxID=904376 RepID=A0A951QEX4_9CYAN|nr:PAS domain S-box protein [Drouetiella hepatica Uher 2000/2452]